jgi:hypothetical protein
MKPKFIFLTIVACILVNCAPARMTTDGVAHLNGSITDIIVKPNVVIPSLKIGIISITGPNSELAESKITMNFMRHGCQVVERSQINSILKEQAFQLSGLVDEENAIKAGKLAGVNAIFIGAINLSGAVFGDPKAPSDLIFTGRLIDVNSGEIIVIGSAKFHNKFGIITNKPIDYTIDDYFTVVFR